MFCFRRNPNLLLAAIRRYSEPCSSKRVLSCCQYLCAKDSTKKSNNRSDRKNKFNENEDTPPLVVQTLAKKLDIASGQETNTNEVKITNEDLQDILNDIYWDSEVSSKRMLHNIVDSEESNDMSDEDRGEPWQFEDYEETITLDDDVLEAHAAQSSNKGQKISGVPDPSVPKSKIPCSGCGAELHCQDPIIPGYMPSEKFKSLTRNEMRQSTCQRCHLMSYHNVCLNVKVDAQDYPKIISKIHDSRGLVVVIVDVTDMRNSIFPDLLKYIGKNRPLYIVGNKVDLIPKDGDNFLKRIREILYEECINSGLDGQLKNIKHVCLVSAKTGYGIEELVTKLMTHWKLKGEVFLVGCTNVGKSSLFNALLQSDYCKSHVRDLIRRATVSVWPGTTLNLLKFPIVRPEGWRLHMRNARLTTESSEKQQELKLKNSKLASKEKAKYESLHGYIGQTDFRGPGGKQQDEERQQEYEGQELVSFSLSRQGNLAEVSGRQHIEDNTCPDMSALDALMPSRWTYDTPGVINQEQIINLLTPEELRLVLPKKVFQPRVFVLNPFQTILVSGLGRIDYCQGEKSVFLAVHCSSTLPVYVMKTAEADDFYNSHLGTELVVPIDIGDNFQRLPALIGRNFQIRGISWDTAAADIQLSSIGWVSVTVHKDHDVIFQAFTPGGRGCHVRTPALLPNVLAFRGERIKGTAGYSLRQIKFPM